MLVEDESATLTGEMRFRVRYAETDKMGVVYNSNYLIWFELGRVELMRDLGYCYRDLENDGYMLPVVETTCRFKDSAAYDDEILIRTRISRLRHSLIQFDYAVYRSEDFALLATGSSTHFVTGRDKRRRPLSDACMSCFERAVGKAMPSSRQAWKEPRPDCGIQA
jgi:acyl-CoA thioester hydrolase